MLLPLVSYSQVECSRFKMTRSLDSNYSSAHQLAVVNIRVDVHYCLSDPPAALDKSVC